MQVIIKARIAKHISTDLKEIDCFRQRVEDTKGRWVDTDLDLDLSKLTRNEVERIRDVLSTTKVLGTKVLAADITKYLRADQDGLDTMQARTVRQAAWMLEHLVKGLPHHMVFSEDAYEGGSHTGYFVSDVRYSPERKERGERTIPDTADVYLAYIVNDARKTLSMDLDLSDVVGRTAKEILKHQGYVLETPTLIAKLKDETERYYQVREQVGVQFTARGVGLHDLDNASKQETRVIYSRAGSKRVSLDAHGEARVVIDVLTETGDKDQERDEGSINLYRWHPWNLRFFSPTEDDLVRHLEADENTDFAPQIQIPVHPLVPVFDLKRHARMRVHLNNLTQYTYRPEVASGLIIPERDRALIDMLVDQSSNNFQDIISNKGQSMNVLSGGPPGTGKCLGLSTPVIMADGRTVMVQDIRQGDLLMGPDSKPRRVLGTVVGRGPLWQITPVKGVPWICNDVHVLTLVDTDTGVISDIALDEWRKKSLTYRGRMKQFSVGVEFPEGPALPIDPYFLGVWFGDGAKFVHPNGMLRSVAVSKPDQEIRELCAVTAAQWGLHVREQLHGTCPTYHLTTGNVGQSESNTLLDAMRDLLGSDLLMPPSYLRASRIDRLRFLAGLIDTDGEYSGCFTITQKREDWARAIWWLARSLGYCSVIRTRIGRCPRGCDRLQVMVDRAHRVVILDRMDTEVARVPWEKGLYWVVSALPKLRVGTAIRGYRVEDRWGELVIAAPLHFDVHSEQDQWQISVDLRDHL